MEIILIEYDEELKITIIKQITYGNSKFKNSKH